MEALGVNVVLISSVGASNFGATDPGLTWIDIEHHLHARRIISTRSDATVIGGVRGVGRGMSDEGIAAIRASAARNGVELLEAPFAELLHRLQAVVRQRSGEKPAMVINVGGSVVAMGDCENGHQMPHGITTSLISCHNGRPALVHRFTHAGTPVMHILNIRRLVQDWGLPHDPIPLPIPGNNYSVYGFGPQFRAISEGMKKPVSVDQ